MKYAKIHTITLLIFSIILLLQSCNERPRRTKKKTITKVAKADTKEKASTQNGKEVIHEDPDFIKDPNFIQPKNLKELQRTYSKYQKKGQLEYFLGNYEQVDQQIIIDGDPEFFTLSKEICLFREIIAGIDDKLMIDFWSQPKHMADIAFCYHVTKFNNKNVFKIMRRIYDEGLAKKKQYNYKFKLSRLLLAIAITSDLNTPRNYHSEESIKRRKEDRSKEYAAVMDPERFYYLIARIMSTNKTKIRYKKLEMVDFFGISNLQCKFLHNIGWAQENVDKSLNSWGDLYKTIKWTDNPLIALDGNRQCLKTLKKSGGQCIEQSYYTVTTAQANGIPAFSLGTFGFSAKRAGHAIAALRTSKGWDFSVGRHGGYKNYPSTTIDNSILTRNFRRHRAYYDTNYKELDRRKADYIGREISAIHDQVDLILKKHARGNDQVRDLVKKMAAMAKVARSYQKTNIDAWYALGLARKYSSKASIKTFTRDFLKTFDDWDDYSKNEIAARIAYQMGRGKDTYYFCTKILDNSIEVKAAKSMLKRPCDTIWNPNEKVNSRVQGWASREFVRNSAFR